MKITNASWFTQMGELKPIGIVFGVDEITGDKKAYIGVGDGVDESTDVNNIFLTGAKIHISQANIIIEHLKE